MAIINDILYYFVNISVNKSVRNFVHLAIGGVVIIRIPKQSQEV